MEFDVDYISTSCGRTPGCLDCGPDNLVAFAARNALAILETHDDGNTRITHTLVEHTDRINSIRWVRSLNGNFDQKIITGSADKTAVIWINDKNEGFIKHSSLIGHTSAINAVDALNGDEFYALTASADSSIKIWNINQGDANCIQTINLGSGLCLALQLFNLPITKTSIFACALDDHKIYLFGKSLNNQYEEKFIRLQTLIGHEDWVRGLDFVRIDKKLMLASCSQDTHVRLWSIEPYIKNSNTNEVQVEKKIISISDHQWTVSLEAVLSAHENWVYGVHWNSKTISCENDYTNLKLLSASLDKSMIIWEFDSLNGVWTENVRVGEVGGGGLGFYGGKFSECGNRIIGHGYTGSLHLWKYIKDMNKWEPDVPCSGHFNEVCDLSWEPNGQFIISTSFDQTTRLHAPWIRDNNQYTTWHEIARPQVHGYDLFCLAVISRYKFTSGAEEKVIRAFKAPHNFVDNFHTICNISKVDIEIQDLPEGASVPSLGLSNKAIYSNEVQRPDINEKTINKQYVDNCFIRTKLEAPPTEETLMQNTLWPEEHKLYGHGYEIFALAASNDGKLLASACKATKLQHAALIIWDTTNWLQMQSLPSHTLTVTQIAFSPDDTCLLSVSRDRRWSIFRKDPLTSYFALDATTDKTNGVHARIIWCCAWTHDSKYFATGSRDGKIVTWSKKNTNNESWKDFCAVTPILNLPNQSITALSFAAMEVNGTYLLAAGFESGHLHIFSLAIQENNSEWTLRLQLNNHLAHHLTIKRVAFRPLVGVAGQSDKDTNKLQLATASSDHCVKLYTIKL